MKVTSKIKKMFNDDLLRYTAAICDTKRIESNAEKMIMLGNLLYTYGIEFEILGGATNRIVLQIDGYAVKFAMDEQGYLDNWMEYSLTYELQDHATKSFETNGYILIADMIEVINTEEKWRLYRYDILKVLGELCQDYLLGDVGYIKKNMTNWGIKDGKPRILDYAYCHRATENLFTCSRCGSVLTYDSNYDVLLCTDRTSCKMRYTYNERKRIQGREVDDKMIAEKKAGSIRMPKGVTSKEIELYGDRLLGDNYYIIDNPGDLYRYNKLKEEMTMNLELNGEGTDMETMDGFTALVRLAKNHTDADAKQVLYQNLGEEAEVPEAVYTENYQNNYAFGYVPPMRIYDRVPVNSTYRDQEETNDQENDDDYDVDGGLSTLVQMAKAKREKLERQFAEDRRNQEDEYFQSLKDRGLAQDDSDEGSTNDDGDADDKAPDNATTDDTTSGHVLSDDEMKDLLAATSKREYDDSPNVDDLKQTSDDSSDNVVYSSGNDTAASTITVNGKPIDIGEEVLTNVGKQ